MNEVEQLVNDINKIIEENYFFFDRIKDSWQKGLLSIVESEMDIEKTFNSISSLIASFGDPHFSLDAPLSDYSQFIGLTFSNGKLYYIRPDINMCMNVESFENMNVQELLDSSGSSSLLQQYIFCMRKFSSFASATLRGLDLNSNKYRQVNIKKDSIAPVIDHRSRIAIDYFTYKETMRFHIFTFPIFTSRIDIGKIHSLLQAIDSKPIVIDIRSNTGGEVDIAKILTTFFIKAPQQLFYVVDASSKENAFANPSGLCLNNNIFILQSEYTASAAEYFFLHPLKKDGAITIGSKSSGFGNQAKKYTFDNGATLCITSKIFVDEHEQMMFPNGIDPQIDLDLPVYLDPTQLINLISQYIE